MPIAQKYMQNFPFVMFYPLYIGQLGQYLKSILNEDNMMNIDNLQSGLKYM